MIDSERVERLAGNPEILKLELQNSKIFTDFMVNYLKDHQNEAPVSDDILIETFSRWYLNYLSMAE